ncbi:MAG: Nramp family divalent metal transporter [Flavobacteriaceae bacterium]|nr:Nramp family divalent metal transporter [Flavobacteriaceae bacterium]
MLNHIFKNLGPATLITAAFIGPGTVTLCSIAGVSFGYQLLWTILVAIAATIFLQEMVMRIGVVSQSSMGEIIRNKINPKGLKVILIFLTISAIVMGNSVYQAGNISGAVLGLETIFSHCYLSMDSLKLNLYPLVVGIVAMALFYVGNYRIIERVLICVVLLMSLSFMVSTIVLMPPIKELLYGLFIPQVPQGSLLTVIGLIGTTVVPYNLFLHAHLSKKKWNNPKNLTHGIWDLMISVSIGGIISLSIMITAAGSNLTSIHDASDLAIGLEPLLGMHAKTLIGFGLFAAGLTSAMTAPLAAAFVTCNCFGWKSSLTSKPFRFVFLIVLAFGVIVSSLDFQLIQVIKFAQVANGVLLPIIVGMILIIINRSDLLGSYVNSRIQNLIGILILLLTTLLSLKSILSVFQFL